MNLEDYLNILDPKAKKHLKPIKLRDCEPFSFIITGSFRYAFIVYNDILLNEKMLKCYRSFPGIKNPKFKPDDSTIDLPDSEYFLTTKDFIDCLYEVVEEKLYYNDNSL